MHLQSQYNMHQQEHQQAGYHPAYPGAQPYNGWPGIALKQIMGQIDFLNNFQGTNNANYPKWNLPKDHTGSNNNVNGYTHHNGNERPMHITPGTQNNVPLPPHQGQPHTPQLPPLPPPSSSRHQQGNFKFNQSYEYPQPVADTSTAWLGPHMWNRKLGLDVSGDRGHHHQSHKFSIENGQADEQNKIKTESSDDLEWFTNLDVKSPSDIEEVATQSQDDDFSQADLALASAPGFKFNPRTRCFTPDELKPQPIIRKRRKMYVSDSDKNEDYWAKRVKNNVAARRSREARRLKENQIALRAAFLERENSALRSQVRVLNVRNEEMKKDVEKLLDNIKILTDTDSNSSSSISNSASPGSVES